MPTDAMSHRRGVNRRAGRMGKGQGATQGVRGDGEVKEPLMTKAHGNEGRDERSARQIADRGNEFVHAPSAKKYNPYE